MSRFFWFSWNINVSILQTLVPSEIVSLQKNKIAIHNQLASIIPLFGFIDRHNCVINA